MGEKTDVTDWISSLPAWQQDLVCRVADTVELDDREFAEALNSVKHAYSIPFAGEIPTPRQFRASLIEDEPIGSTPKLIKFGALRGVGMIVEDAEIPFGADGLSVVYGQNAVGKSSYVRALKALCRTVDTERRPWGNVFKDANELPAAHIELLVDGEVHSSNTPLEGDDAVHLKGVSVFDSASAELYVDEKNTIQYVPSKLQVLSRLAALQDRLRTALDEERADVMNRRPSTDTLPEDTRAGAAVRALRGSDADPKLADIAALSSDEITHLAELKAAVAAADASTARQDGAVASGDATDAENLAINIEALAAMVGAEGTEQLRRACAESRTANEAVEIAAREFDAAPMTGIGTEPWRLLWSAARDFATAEGAAFPPEAGNVCPLCLQVLDPSSAERMAHFENHVMSTVQAAADAAAEHLSQGLADRDPARVEPLRAPFVDRLLEREPAVAGPLIAYLDQLTAHLEGVRSKPDEAVALAETPEAALATLRKWGMGRKEQADRLISATDDEASARLRQELRELEARQVLRDRLDEFELWRGDLRVVDKIDAAWKALATNKITTYQGDRAEEIVGDPLKNGLNRELGHLNCQHLPISADFKREKGATKAVLRLAARHSSLLKSIASEGEWRAVALAFFFAELSVRHDDAGIILDDPVSSLDDERRKYIADRLIEESTKRQVIIFTHDLPFLADLHHGAKANDVAMSTCGMWRWGDDVGRVDSEIPFKALSLKKRVGQLRDRAAQWDAQQPANQDEAWRRVTQFYRDLRASWERAVEERLFKGVVQRLQRDVMTKQLRSIAITEDLVKQIDTGMTRTSQFLHDEAAAAPMSLPSRADLQADVEALASFEKAVPAP